MGHLIPILEFAKQLLQLQPNKLSFTLIIPGKSPLSQSQQSLFISLPTSISYITLPPINLDDMHQDGNVVLTQTRLTMSRSLPHLRDVLNSLFTSHNLVALVVDLFGTEAFHVAEKLNLLKYIFFPTSTINLSVFLHLSELDKKISCEYKDYPHPIQLPGCVPIEGKDLLTPLQDRKKEGYKWVLELVKKYPSAEGIIVNSFEELEPEALRAISESGNLKVYPVGFFAMVKGWAPQAQILRHGSAGGFLTHGGWNSTLEAMTSAVPLIAWPLYAEQRTNAAMLNESLKVAIRPTESENGLIGSFEVANVGKRLMKGEEGKQVRGRMRELKIAAGRAASENGSSTRSLLELSAFWTS